MPTGQRTADTSFLEAALIGFLQMKWHVEENIADIRRQLGFGRRRASRSGAANR
jgi:hypothetical protein